MFEFEYYPFLVAISGSKSLITTSRESLNAGSPC